MTSIQRLYTEGYVVMLGRVGLSVCPSICPSNYSKSNHDICIKPLPEVSLGPRNNRRNYDLHPAYDPDRTDLHVTFTRCVSRANEQCIFCLSKTVCFDIRSVRMLFNS